MIEYYRKIPTIPRSGRKSVIYQVSFLISEIHVVQQVCEKDSCINSGEEQFVVVLMCVKGIGICCDGRRVIQVACR